MNIAGVTSQIEIYKQVTTIPSATVQLMDNSAPYTLITTNDEFYAIPIACYIYILNGTVGYSGYVHLHLTNSASYTATELNSVLSEIATSGPLQSPKLYSMLINCQQAGFFGGEQNRKNLEIFFDTLPTAGDGDMVVTLFYTRNNIF